MLSKSRTEANKQNIHYLFGQLAIAHKRRLEFSRFLLSDARFKYDGTQWANEISPIVNLLYLSKFFDDTIYCSKDSKASPIFMLVDSEKVVPTLSPKDPKFAEWYKNEYEPRMKDWKWPEV